LARFSLSSLVRYLWGHWYRVARWYILKRKIPFLGKFWRALEWKMLVYFMKFGVAELGVNELGVVKIETSINVRIPIVSF
jgi:hypothetical protein